MRALVVYESMFGNTEAVARSVAEGLSGQMPVDVVEVGSAPATLGEDITCLVVGGPTHAFGMSRAQTRRDAARQAGGEVVSKGRGVREWLDEMTGSASVAGATFDTRINKSWIPGSAAKAIRKRLRKKGLRTIGKPESFYVQGTPGPLIEGELARARRWGETLPNRLRPSAGSS